MQFEQFITGAPRPLSTQRFLTTLVAADIVGSTDLIARVGDARWRDLLARHYDLVSRRLTMHSGIEVDRAGDGFLATCDGPGRAILCACAIRDAVRAMGLEVRAGLHTGEVEPHGDELRAALARDPLLGYVVAPATARTALTIPS